MKLCSPLKVNRSFGRIRHLHLPDRQASNQHEDMKQSFVYSSTLKMEATCSSETSVYFQRTTKSYIKKTEFFVITTVRSSNCIYKNQLFGI
jgi:hypothetical protein